MNTARAARYASTTLDSRRSLKRQSNEYGVWPVVPVQLFNEGVQKIFEGRTGRAATIRPPGSAFLLSQNSSLSNLSLACAEPMNVDGKDGSHTRKSVQRRNRNSASSVLHVVLADAQSLRCFRRTHAGPVEGSVEARPDSAPKGVVLLTALEVPDWISMSSHLPASLSIY